MQWSTTKGTSSALSRGSRARSTPNTVPLLCSHSSWNTSMHFLCNASPHWKQGTRTVCYKLAQYVNVSCSSSHSASCIHIIPPHIQHHWQQCSCRTACTWPSCSSFSWVGVLVQLEILCVFWLAGFQCTLRQRKNDKCLMLLSVMISDTKKGDNQPDSDPTSLSSRSSDDTVSVDAVFGSLLLLWASVTEESKTKCSARI